MILLMGNFITKAGLAETTIEAEKVFRDGAASWVMSPWFGVAVLGSSGNTATGIRAIKRWERGNDA
jgi:hypothetical protein